MEELMVSGKKCMIEETGTVRTVFLWAYHDFSGNGFERLIERMERLPSFQDAAVATFSISDWDAELSPWEAPAAFGEERFRGNGPETLLRLTWNKGGHFADAEARLVKGIQWFLQSSSFSDGVCSTWVR